jgi:hypothetical protein
MRKHPRLVLVILLLPFAVVVFFLPPVHWRVIGWAQGEAFCATMPTSYWSQALDRWDRDWDEHGVRGELEPADSKLRRAVGLSSTVDPGHPGILTDPTDEKVPVLIALLHDSSPGVRELAADALAELCPKGRAAIPGLLQALEREVDLVRVQHAVAHALREIDPETAERAGVGKPPS